MIQTNDALRTPREARADSSGGNKLEQADATVTLNRSTLDDIALGVATVDEKIGSGETKILGKKKALDELLALLDHFEFWFNIVTLACPPKTGPSFMFGSA